MSQGASSPHPAGAPTLVVLAAGQAKRYGGPKPLAPVGTGGEAVIDVLASDALAAGFGRLVLVIGPGAGPAIRYHVERTWPDAVDVGFAVQPAPRGTVDAVLAARSHLGASAFGVANADDLYGEEGLRLLARQLAGGDGHALVSYRLANSLIGGSPVTRGLCQVGDDGFLAGIDERRQVTPLPDGRIVARDDCQPSDLDPDWPVSMNLWGFGPAIWPVLDQAVAEAAGEGEVLLPEVVGDLLAGRREAGPAGTSVAVVAAEGRCIGVTHPGDLPLVQADLASQVGRGDRPAQLWAGAGAP